MTGYEFAEAGPVRRLVRRTVTSRPVAWLSVRYLPSMDRFALRLSRGRGTFSGWVSGLPVVRLTTTGARSGRLRTTPVLGVPDGDGLVVIAANFGEPRNPAWYHNLKAHPRATVTRGSVSREFTALELTGTDRDRRFEAAVRMNPGWLNFRSRAGARQIPVVRLTPISSPPPT
ncbi:nitroreductase family deazaflavin-dependent oxidoreductase [Actinoplanes sp. LDG1-06]|uniref:Nitroreductase family deazaflavin-dependent oxidoreductase n=1 Tax=Paractinoplanes ovalisporus TaxID=2810368 RepID=A0ABS2ANG1_9ACTN|nr:nitroreductase family deazaflavin-dependent oxidoreductase [Actinoplanes ovalisporus]MBM2621404.1 nitroreductase family deazaflavin-dependent oxidoreductase [Actinoplanes ovalisporus]